MHESTNNTFICYGKSPQLWPFSWPVGHTNPYKASMWWLKRAYEGNTGILALVQVLCQFTKKLLNIFD